MGDWIGWMKKGSGRLAGWLGGEAKISRAMLVACLVWGTLTLAVVLIVAADPDKRTVTDIYHEVVADWGVRPSIYRGPGKFNYLPPFVQVFMPFAALPSPWGDVAWRLFNVGMLVSGLWLATRLFFDKRSAPLAFALATGASLLLCAGAIRNGQANALLGAAILHAVAHIGRRRWWLAALFVGLAVAIKPLGIVLALLAPWVYAPLRWRVPLAVLAVLALPFLFAPPDYVVDQYVNCFNNLRECSEQPKNRFADIGGLVRTTGQVFGRYDWIIPHTWSMVIRVLAGGATWLLLIWGFLRTKDEAARAMWLGALAVGYLMLFNPMNEANSYVMLAPLLGCWGAWFLLSPRTPESRGMGVAILCAVLSMGFVPELLRPIFKNFFSLVYYPLVTIFFLLVLSRFMLKPRAASQEPVLDTPTTT